MHPDLRPPRARRALILVVEQDPQMRRLERYFLEQAGFVVEFADDGHQGLESARRLLPDIVVAEILVAGLDGLSVCRTLKSDPATRGIRVLIFSILAAEQRALAAGADAFLLKPLDDSRLVQSVEALLGRPSEVPGDAAH
jgi:two-component system, OmpR family, phosphate regulon response regulator PhoB